MRARMSSLNLTFVILALIALAPLGLPASARAGSDLGVMTALSLEEQASMILTAAGHAKQAVAVWLSDHYQRVPTLMLGLALLIVFPIISIISAFARSLSKYSVPSDQETERTKPQATGQQRVAMPLSDRVACQAGQPMWPSKAMVELRDPTGRCRPARYPLSRPVIQIGRADDVDIIIHDPTVHRYHATIHCTEDAEYLVTDMSAGTGNGVVVNGHPVMQHQIFNGDEIRLGRARLMFLTAQT